MSSAPSPQPHPCHPERSEGSIGPHRSLAALGMTPCLGATQCMVATMSSVILVRDWRTTEAALRTAREDGTSPTLVTPEDAASFYGAGYLAALQDRAREEFPDVPFTLVIDCGDAPGHALACLRAG